MHSNALSQTQFAAQLVYMPQDFHMRSKHCEDGAVPVPDLSGNLASNRQACRPGTRPANAIPAEMAIGLLARAGICLSFREPQP